MFAWNTLPCFCIQHCFHNPSYNRARSSDSTPLQVQCSKKKMSVHLPRARFQLFNCKSGSTIHDPPEPGCTSEKATMLTRVNPSFKAYILKASCITSEHIALQDSLATLRYFEIIVATWHPCLLKTAITAATMGDMYSAL